MPNILRDRAGIPDGEREYPSPDSTPALPHKPLSADTRHKTVQLWNSVLVGVYGAAIFVGSRKPCRAPLCLFEPPPNNVAIFGWLADHASSHRAPLLLGYAALACSTLLLHKGPTLTMLVFGRILQGLSAAAVCSVGFAMLYDAFGSHGIGGALGWVSAALDTGGFLGPGLAGLLYEAGGEDAVFLSAYGFIAVDVAMGLLVIVADNPPGDGSESLVLPTSDTVEKQPEYVPLPDSPVDESALLSDGDSDDDEKQSYNVPSASPCRRSSTAAPLIQLLLLPRVRVAVSGWLVVGVFETAFDSVLPLFVQDTFNWPIAGAGLIFLPFYLPSIVVSPLCGYVADRIRNAPRVFAAAGFFLCGPSFILLGYVDGIAVAKQILLCVLLALIGVGTALSGPPLLKEIAVVVEAAERASLPGTFGPRGATATAYGVHNAAFAIGNLLGPVLAGAFKAALGWAAMGWFFGVLSLASGVVVLVCLEGYIGNVVWTRRGQAIASGDGRDGGTAKEQQEQLIGDTSKNHMDGDLGGSWTG